MIGTGTGPIRLAILGSTGSVGRQTLDVVRERPDLFQVQTLAAGSSAQMLEAQVREFRPKLVSLDPGIAFDPGVPVQVERGDIGLLACAAADDVDIVVVATAGVASISAVLGAAHLGRPIALANKEALVCAADLVLPAVRENEADLRPVDSEHSAIWQCLGTLYRDDVESITLTASGGPFRTLGMGELHSVTAEDALNHPTWDMGRKITIDSASLVNKGLEVIEAHHLFGLSFDRIGVVIHPESIIHSLVGFRDGSTLAQLGEPDMRLPIQYALTWPQYQERRAERIDLARLGSLTFAEPDNERFPALNLCIQAGRAGRTYPTALCAADQVAVDAFLAGRIPFPGIAEVISDVLDAHSPTTVDSLAAIEAALADAKRLAEARVARFG